MTRLRPQVPREDLMRLMQFRPYHTHAKILLFISIMIGLGAIAWTSDSAWVRWMAYIGLGYMQMRSEEHTSELQSLMRTSYAVFCLKKKIHQHATIIALRCALLLHFITVNSTL